MSNVVNAHTGKFSNLVTPKTILFSPFGNGRFQKRRKVVHQNSCVMIERNVRDKCLSAPPILTGASGMSCGMEALKGYDTPLTRDFTK